MKTFTKLLHDSTLVAVYSNMFFLFFLHSICLNIIGFAIAGLAFYRKTDIRLHLIQNKHTLPRLLERKEMATLLIHDG